jgi:serine/threonine-protein kinase
MPRVGDIVAGKYRIESVIGEGGMGAVFAATHTVTEKRVALKWMRPDLVGQHGAVQRFMREAQAAGRLNHPNVVDIYDIGEHDGSPFLVMEYLQGEPLGAALERSLLSPQQVVRYLIPAMRGVSAAHARGVVHRDLKPDNIFLCKNADGSDREPKVLDFGISKVTSADGALNPRLTRTGAVMGTPYYMSPEQLRDAAEIDERTDVYAFGVILYEALTGRVPFDAENYSALILEIATGTPKRPRQLRPEIPEGLERIVLKAMARDPDDRYANVDGLGRALEPYSRTSSRAPRKDRKDKDQDEPIEPQRASLSVTTPFVSDSPLETSRRRPWLGAAAAVLLALAGGGTWWALKPPAGGPSSSTIGAAAGAPPVHEPGELGAASEPRAPAATKADPLGHEERAAVAADAGVKPGLPEPAELGAAAAPATAPAASGGQPPAGADHRGRVPSGRSTEVPVRGRGRTGGLRTDEF